MAEFSLIHHVNMTALLFPGQGSQSVGMATAVAAAYPAARLALAEADEVLGFGLSKMMAEGPEEALTDTINAQPALLADSMAVMRAVEAALGERLPAGGKQVAAAGHSMGEYSALVAAGAISYADGLKLVRERGRLMKEAGLQAPGLMAAILGLDEARVAQLCAEASQTSGGIAGVANDNCPGQVVISGDRLGMEAAMMAISAAGAKKVMPLAVSIAAHSSLMQPAAAALRAAIAATPVHTPVVPVIGNTTAAPLTDADAIRAELTAQLTGSVRWSASVQTMAGMGVTRYVELGSGEVLVGLVKRIVKGAERLAVTDPEGVQALMALL
jgi:[acyl-carrier-protein] S-malonyltransferase